MNRPIYRTPPAEFRDLVRDALQHLHDTGHLQRHPLAADVVPDRDAGAPRARLLMDALIGAVEALRPAPGADARAWRSYRLLELRYLDGLPGPEVASELAISRAQYGRDHGAALDAVAAVLWERWPRGERPARVDEAVLHETEQLAAHLRLEPVDLGEMAAQVVALTREVAAEHGIRVELTVAPGLPLLSADRPALRQVCLSLLDLVLEVGRGVVPISVAAGVSATGEAVALSVALPELRRDPAEAELDVIRRLGSLVGGALRVVGGAGRQLTLLVPVTSRPTLLVVDNNQDFVALVARMLAGHPWRVLGARDVREAERLVQQAPPTVVLLDLILPGQDAWDLLLTLKQRDQTRQVPVIVCSVLHEPHVARALGAAGCLDKPVSQTDLLAALAPWSPAGPARAG